MIQQIKSLIRRFKWFYTTMMSCINEWNVPCEDCEWFTLVRHDDNICGKWEEVVDYEVDEGGHYKHDKLRDCSFSENYTDLTGIEKKITVLKYAWKRARGYEWRWDIVGKKTGWVKK